MSLRRHLPFVAFSAFAAIAANSACGSTTAVVTEAPPPRICKVPGPTPTKWFTDATAEFGLSGAGVEPLATSVVSADFDGDGWADLIAMRGDSTRGLVGGMRVRFLLMNRPDPNDPKKRVFVDVPDQGGLLATRDGTDDRGASIALVGDLDNDGDVDVITCPSDFTTNDVMLDTCAAFLNDGNGHFTLAPRERARPRYPATSAVLLDVDRDGVLDFWPAGMAHWPYGGIGGKWNIGPRLFGGNGDGTFGDVTAQSGSRPSTAPQRRHEFRHTFGVTTCDIDDDGDQDMLTASYGRQENWVWRNDGGHFIEVAQELGLDHDDNEDYSATTSRIAATARRTGLRSHAAGARGGLQRLRRPYFRGWYPGSPTSPEPRRQQLRRRPAPTSTTTATWTWCSPRSSTATSAGRRIPLSSSSTRATAASSSGRATTHRARSPGDAAMYWNHGDNMPVFADVDLDGRKDFYLTSTVYPRQPPVVLASEARRHLRGDGIPAGLGLVDPRASTRSSRASTSWTSTGTAISICVVARPRIPRRSTCIPQRRGPGRRTSSASGSWRNGAGYSNASAIGARVRVTAGGRTQTLEVKGGAGHRQHPERLRAHVRPGRGVRRRLDRGPLAGRRRDDHHLRPRARELHRHHPRGRSHAALRSAGAVSLFSKLRQWTGSGPEPAEAHRPIPWPRSTPSSPSSRPRATRRARSSSTTRPATAPRSRPPSGRLEAKLEEAQEKRKTHRRTVRARPARSRS